MTHTMDFAALKLASPVKPKRYPGETIDEFRARVSRENELQIARDRDPSRGPQGRRLAVRYDE
jgi:hypothetical protein